MVRVRVLGCLCVRVRVRLGVFQFTIARLCIRDARTCAHVRICACLHVRACVNACTPVRVCVVVAASWSISTRVERHLQSAPELR
eukprot:1938752-Pleurochrysis_carterae.AAC.2